MGVPGLWEIINQSCETRSVAHLSVVDGFEANAHGTRTLRVGIDASLWLQHVSTAKWLSSKRPGARDVGASPELRTLFFKLAHWAKLPASLLFVFDGRARPREKRGSRMGKSGTHALAPRFKELIALFGMDWREALGEAEAELAFLSQTGAIDAVVTDDIDCLIFGAQTVIKNFSLNLSGNKRDPPKNADGKVSQAHAHIYTADRIRQHPQVCLTRGGLVLFALMSGGDYDAGLFRCGPSMAHAMARMGFGDRLIQAYERLGDNARFSFWLEQWRAELQAAIRANTHGLMARGAPNFVVPQDWPKTKTIALYVNPATSGGDGGGPPKDRGPLDLPGLARFCERHFEDWGYRSAILRRFGSVLTQSLVMRVLRAAALEADSCERDRRAAQGLPAANVLGPLRPRPDEAVGTSAALVRRTLAPRARGGGGYPAQRPRDLEALRSAFVRPDTPEPGGAGVEHVEDTPPLVVGITGRREHVSTDRLPELRVRVCREQLVTIAESGIRGLHDEPGPRKRWVAYADEEPDEEGEEDGDAGAVAGQRKRGKKTDPRDDMLLWVPESIMRQVHPALVEQWENNVARGGRARGSRAASEHGTAVQRRTRPVEPQDNRHEVFLGADLPPMLTATVAPPPVQPPAPKRAAKGKGKARSVRSKEYDYLSINPYASSAPPEHDFNPLVDTSLPFRCCGFMFTWPDPDDPDQLIVDTDERDDLPTSVDYRQVGHMGVFGEYDHAAVSRSAPRAKRTLASTSTPSTGGAPAQLRASALLAHEEPAIAGTPTTQLLRSAVVTPKKRKLYERQTGAFEDDSDAMWDEPQDDGRNRFSQHAQEIDRYLGIGPNGEHVAPSIRPKKTRGRKPPVLGPPAAPMSAPSDPRHIRSRDDKGSRRAGLNPSPLPKRRRLAEVQDTGSTGEPGPSSSGSTFIISKQVEPLFWESASSRSPSPLTMYPYSPNANGPPPSSSPFTTPSTSRSRRTGIPSSVPASPCPTKRHIDDDIISISSDSGDDVHTREPSPDNWLKDLDLPLFNGTPSFYRLRKARESQQSLLSLNAATHLGGQNKNQDDAVDIDPGSSALSSLNFDFESPSRIGPSSASASSGRAYRASLPSSSQGGAFDDDVNFFKDVTLVRVLD